MPRAIECLVLTPVGPKSNPGHVEDTVASFCHYMSPAETAMVVLDDTGSDVLARRLPARENVVRIAATDVFPYPRPAGRFAWGTVFAKQLAALELITREYDWRCLMRLDDDALILGPDPHRDALAVFERHADVGVLGAYRRRGDGTDKREALAEKGREIRRQIVSRDVFRHPAMVRRLVRLVIAAKRHGYRLGDMCTGGSFFLSRRAYDGFRARWPEDPASLRFSWLSEDLLYALHAAAAGYRVSDFPPDRDIMAINWRGLPMPVEELVRRGKKVVHPVKDIDDPMFEADVRRFFRSRREHRGVAVPHDAGGRSVSAGRSTEPGRSTGRGRSA